MELKKPEKLSVLLERDAEEFAKRITGMVDDSYDKFRVYRDKCWSNERVWRSRHWDNKPFKNQDDTSRPRPNVPVLHSMIEKSVADIMDNLPDAIIRGTRADVDIRALIATELIRFAMQRAKYPVAFERKARAAFKTGTGVTRTYWDPDIANGMGDVAYRYEFIDNVVWDAKAANINEGRFCALIDWLPPEDIYDMYPDIDLEACIPQDEDAREKRSNETENISSEYKDGRIRVITFMWREKAPRTVERQDAEGNTVDDTLGNTTYINSAVVIGNTVAESKLNQYEYDRYMVNMLPYIEIEGWPVGLSAIDIYQDDADIINLIEQLYVCNLQASAETRWLVDRTANINKKALLNFNEKIIEGDRIHEGAVREFKPVQFSGQALNYKNAKMDEIKDQMGQMNLNNGVRDGDITSGIGIQSMQEYGAKLMRLQTRHFYEDHREMVKDTLKLMQTHYNTARVIRMSRNAQDEIEKLIEQAQKAIMQAQQQAQQQGAPVDRDAAMAAVLPEGVKIVGNEMTIDFSVFNLEYIDLDYDIEIIPQKKSAATSAMLNNIVAQWAANGTIPAALATELLEFEGKEFIAKKVKQYTDIEAQLQQAQKTAQQAADQAEQAAKVAQQLTEENNALQQKIWVEKFKSLRKELTADAQTGEEGEGEGEEDLPADADEAIGRLQDEILGGVQQGAA